VHPNLARVHDFGMARNGATALPFFTSAAIDGRPFSEWASNKSWPEVVSALGQALVALRFLHDNQVLHGDFKPDNVLVDDLGHGVLIDLSCASRLGRVVSGGVSGTPGFMPPELLKQEPTDERADLFAVGVTLARIADRGVRPPPEALRLAQRLCSERREDRPASVDEVLDVLGVPARARGGATGELGMLVGRATIVERFKLELGRGGAHGIVLSGARGMGKSRLLRELKWIAETSLATVEGFASRPDAIRSMLSRAIGDPDLPPSPLAAVRARDAIVARGEPVVLVLDDVDELAPDQRAIWDALLRVVELGDPIVTLGTETRESTAETPDSWAVGPLDDDAIEQWLAAERCPEASEAVIAASGGHPERIIELVRALHAGVPASDLMRVASAQVRGALVDAAEPASPTVRRALVLLGASLEPLDGATVNRLVGADLDFDGLLRARLVVLEGAGFVAGARVAEPAGGASEPDAELRAWAHRALAAELAAREDDAASAVAAQSDLAARRTLHLLLAGDREGARAVFESSASRRRAAPRAWTRVAAQARDLLEADLARELAQTLLRAGEARVALELLSLGSHADDQDLAALLLVAECRLELGDAGAALTILRRVPAQAEMETRARAAALESRAHARLGAYAQARDAALGGLAMEASDEATADLHEAAGVAGMYSESYESAQEHLLRARSLHQLGHEPRKLVRSWSYEAILAFRRGDLDTARAAYEQALAAAEQHGVADQIARCSLNLGTACHQRGELHAAFAAYERGERLALALDQQDLSLVIAFNAAKLHADAGALDRAAAKAERVLALAHRRGATFFVAAIESVLADVSLCRGDVEAARRGFERARDGFAAQGALREVAEEQLELARVHVLLGDVDAARALLDAGIASEAFEGADDLKVRAALVEARLAFGRGDTGGARSQLGAALRVAERAHLPELQARALSLLSDVAHKESLIGEAQELRDKARGIWSRMTSQLAAAAVDAFWKRPERLAARSVVPPGLESPARSSPRTAKLERLLTAFRKLNSSVETADVLALAIDEAIDVTGAERGFLLLDPGDGELEIAVARNVDRASVEPAHLRFSRSIAARAISGGEVVLTVDAQSDDRFRANVSVHAMRLRSVIAVPIRSPDGVLGALYLDNRYLKARFDEQDTDLLLAFADQVALALRTARLVEALRKRQLELDLERRRVEELAEGQALEIVRLHQEVRIRQEALEHRYDYSEIVGRAPALQKVFAILDRVIDSPLSILVSGESGTGKELVARAIHYGSARKAAPFVGINCAALPASLLESELFGHARGAFTGAERDREGLVVSARGGTLFLDELGEMPLDVQAKLLRVLQEKEVRPLGSHNSVAVDFRLVCATNRDLRAEVDAGRFREDLFYRVGVVEVRVPPLRERLEDLPELALTFTRRAADQIGRPLPRLTAGALRKLSSHAWPGNVRELENVVTKAVVLADGDELRGEDIELPGAKPAVAQLQRAGRAPAASDERDWILAALHETGWNAVQAARDLGMPRATFYRRLRSLGLARPSK